MLKGYIVVLKNLKNLSAKADLGIHHIFFNCDNREALLTCNTCDYLVGVVVSGRSHDHSASVLRLIGVLDVYRDISVSDGEYSILMKNCCAHIRKLTKLSVCDGLYSAGGVDNSRVSHHKARNVCPVLIKVSRNRSCNDRAGDIRATS